MVTIIKYIPETLVKLIQETSQNFVIPHIHELIMLLIGFPLIWFVSKKLEINLRKFTSAHVAVICTTIFFYGAQLLLLISILNQLGFNLSALLGAAGIFGVAIGFAAQTTISNVISGIFLLLERNFSIGDFVKIGDTYGTIDSIDLLALKIKTSENKLVRIPNEQVIKNQVVNLSFYPKRRVHFIFQVPFDVSRNEKEVAQQTHSIIEAILFNEPMVRKEPTFSIIPLKFGDGWMEFQARVWIDKVHSGKILYKLAEQCNEINKSKATMLTIRQD